MTTSHDNDIHCDISDDDLQALVDGELPAAEQAVLYTRLVRSPAAKARYDALKRQKAALKAWWRERPAG